MLPVGPQVLPVGHQVLPVGHQVLPVGPLPPIILPPPPFPISKHCTVYNELYLPTRKFSSPQKLKCDCDCIYRREDWKGTGWYRITGGAGTQLADFVVDKKHCGTGATGWMEGGHPTVSQGEVTRTVNFNYFGNEAFKTTRIRVINCYTHYVYYLEDTPECYLGYCTA